MMRCKIEIYVGKDLAFHTDVYNDFLSLLNNLHPRFDYMEGLIPDELMLNDTLHGKFDLIKKNNYEIVIYYGDIIFKLK